MRLLASFVALVAAVLVVAPVWAGAATVSLTEDGESATLLYEAGLGEVNAVVINGTGHPVGIQGWLVTEEGGVTLTPGTGCMTVTPQMVSCDLTATEAALEVVVNLGDEGDSVSAAGACGYIFL